MYPNWPFDGIERTHEGMDNAAKTDDAEGGVGPLRGDASKRWQFNQKKTSQ